MKKLILILILISIAGFLTAQTSNSFKYVVKAKGGLINTLKGEAADKIDSTKVSGGLYKNYQGATELGPSIPASSQVNLDTIYSKRDVVDTVHLTGSRAIPLTYRGAMGICYNSN